MTYNARLSPLVSEMPARIRQLPITEQGWPKLFFAAMIEGKPDLRVADRRKKYLCDMNKLCWICGQPLGRMLVSVIGPMCVVNRITSEPPQHYDCARFAARACPFLVQPRMVRNTKDLPEERLQPAGFSIARNPGCCAVYVTRTVRKFNAHHGGHGELYSLGDPERVEWYCEGREATRTEIEDSINSGLPQLEAMCDRDPDPKGARIALEGMKRRAMLLLPAWS